MSAGGSVGGRNVCRRNVAKLNVAGLNVLAGLDVFSEPITLHSSYFHILLNLVTAAYQFVYHRKYRLNLTKLAVPHLTYFFLVQKLPIKCPRFVRIENYDNSYVALSFIDEA